MIHCLMCFRQVIVATLLMYMHAYPPFIHMCHLVHPPAPVSSWLHTSSSGMLQLRHVHLPAHALTGAEPHAHGARLVLAGRAVLAGAPQECAAAITFKSRSSSNHITPLHPDILVATHRHPRQPGHGIFRGFDIAKTHRLDPSA